jgi:hypothetical protein
MLLNLSYRLEVLVIFSTFDSCFFHGLSYLIFVRNIYHNYHNTIIDGHIYVILLVILWQSFQLQDKSWYAHNTVFGLKTLHDNAHNLTHLKIFQGSVSSCLFWRPGNVLIQTKKNPSNFAFLVTLLCFFKMAFACSALSLNLAIESLASSA